MDALCFHIYVKLLLMNAAQLPLKHHHSDEVHCPRTYKTVNTSKFFVLVLANELLIYVYNQT